MMAVLNETFELKVIIEYYFVNFFFFYRKYFVLNLFDNFFLFTFSNLQMLLLIVAEKKFILIGLILFNATSKVNILELDVDSSESRPCDGKEFE